MNKHATIALLTTIALIFSGCERRPAPTDFMVQKLARKEFKKHRKEWIEEMHRTAPGVDYRVIDRETRSAKNASRLAKGTSSMSVASEPVAEGHLYGTWRERGSNNLAGRMHTADVDFEHGYIYNGSSGGNIWRANLDGEGWTCLNNAMQIGDIKMVRIFNHHGDKRLVVAGSSPPAVYYTDDEGATWNTAIGLDDIASWGWFRSGQVVNDSARTIYLLGAEWDYDLWTQRTVVYKSVDHGESFYKIYDYGLSSGLFDLWTSRYDTSSCYMFIRETITAFDRDDNLDTIASFSVTGGISDVSNVNLTGCVHDGEVYLYSAHAYNEGHTDVHASTDGGATWAYRGNIEERPFLNSGNNFTCSNVNPNALFFGAVQAYRSHDGGIRWTLRNHWWEYYDNEDTMLHADIPGIDAILTPAGDEFLLISTDGGLYISNDSLLTVDNLSLSGLAVSQYYSTYTCRFDPRIIYVGSQDQGYQRCQSDSGGMLDFDQLISGDYGHIVSSDGGSSVWTDYPGFAMYYPNAAYTEWKVTWDFEGSNYLWMPPIMEDPEAVDHAYLGGGGTDGGAHIWHLHARALWVSAEEHPYNFSLGEDYVRVAAMEYSPIDPHYRYVMSSVGNFFLSTDGGATWTHTPAFEGPHSHYFYGSSIIASNTNLGTVYIAGSGYSNPPVYRSTDHGLTFSAMDDGMPNTLVYEMAITPDEDMLFAATEVGPYVFIFDEGRWFDMSGLSAPDQIYWTVDYVPTISTARFGTYGRGIWDFQVDSLTIVSEEVVVEKPMKPKLSAHPNPFNDRVTISFDITRDTSGELKIFDSAGRLIARLHDGELKSGMNSFTWDGRTITDAPAPSGNYLALLKIGDLTSNVKIVMVK